MSSSETMARITTQLVMKNRLDQGLAARGIITTEEIPSVTLDLMDRYIIF